jgi:hypothetical protein
VDFDKWTLTVTGSVQKPGDYTLTQIQAASPKVAQNTRHVCVEGWDVIGNFGGVRLFDFLKTIGADPTARFVTVECADDYYESLDMATAMHPQSLLCYEMYGQRLTREHGAPLRLNIPIKIGYSESSGNFYSVGQDKAAAGPAHAPRPIGARTRGELEHKIAFCEGDQAMVVNCEQVWQEISNYLEEDVDPNLRAAMEAHFRECERCRSVLEAHETWFSCMVTSA